MDDKTNLEEAVEQLGQKIIEKEHVAYALNEDKISREIVRYKRKYGKNWFKKYTKHVSKMARLEIEKLKVKDGNID